MSKLLYFSAAWCGPCKVLGPKIQQLQSEGLNIQKVDVDQDQALSAQYGVRNIPTIIKIDASGNAGERLVGNQTVEAIRALAVYRGTSVGLKAAESFKIERLISS